ncbi:hypothetical protein [Pseudomonas fluorescens]|uniref:Uncharacterized protein n=1 Tax=Pseudomonas fluorescens TaxID=294 RepID=A0A5E7D6X8_PSEFL|nr:hypothetical protein [Pseudomonas fluorescens]VVO09748.1 hypothetical protein PS723_03323 [Pseudomonas fluorescens]
MTATTMGIKGHCAHCQITLVLKPWQLNAIAINEAFACANCQRTLQLSCPKQLRRLKSLDSLGMLRAGMLVLICTALLVALVMEWVGLISVVAQLNFSLIAILLYFIILRFARHRQRMTLILQAAKAHVD